MQLLLLAFSQVKESSQITLSQKPASVVCSTLISLKTIGDAVNWSQNIQSLSVHKSASLSHQRQMSDTLSRRKEPANASTSQINSGSNDNSARFPSVSFIQNSATSVSCSSSSNALEAVFADSNISSMTGCTFQIMTGPVQFVNEPAAKRPRRIIIKSDDEDKSRLNFPVPITACFFSSAI